MKSFAKVAFALPLMVAAGAAQAHPGLHPHVADAPLVDLHPALGLALVVACWAGLVWAAEAYNAAHRRPVAAFRK